MASLTKGHGRPLTCSSCSNAQLQPPDLHDALCEAAVQHLVTQTVCNGRHVMWSPGLESPPLGKDHCSSCYAASAYVRVAHAGCCSKRSAAAAKPC
jgi:hypothetical protein